VIRGGNSNNGANDGSSYVNVNNDLGNTNANYGGRLASVSKQIFNEHKLVTSTVDCVRSYSTEYKAPVGGERRSLRPLRSTAPDHRHNAEI